MPPEAVLVAPDRDDLPPCTAENVLPARVKKVRSLGQITNLVLAGDGLELNSLHGREIAGRLGLAVGDRVVALVAAAAIRTSAVEEAA